MRIRIGPITYRNFKCFKDYTADFQYVNAVVRAENGIGKTSLKDGVFWVLYDKDSSGRKRFGMRPIDTNPDSPHYGQAIPVLVVAVEFPLLIDGEVKTFRKEQHEKIDKAGRFSYPNKYWIDGYAMPEGEYKKALANICPEDIFRLLTELDYFNNDKKFDRQKRREMLVELGGHIGNPAGFEGLIARLNGHDIKEYEKLLKDRKALLVKEQEENITRIDEKQRDLVKYAQIKGDSITEQVAKRDLIIEDIADLGRQQAELLGTEKQRAELTEKKNDLIEQRLHRENIVINQSGPVDYLNAERAAIEQAHADKTQELVNLQNGIRAANTTIESVQNDIAQWLSTLVQVRAALKAAKENPATDICYACGQKLPANKLAENMNKREMELADIEERGDKIKDFISERRAELLEMQEQLSDLISKRTEMVADLKAAEAAKNERIAEINEVIKKQPQADPKDDEQWQKLAAEIEKIQAQIGEPVSAHLEKIESRKKTAEEELAKINELLAAADSIAKDEARIKELDARQTELAQLIADCDKELEAIKQYNVAHSKMVEAAVNDKFEHVTFKLFDYFQNGEIDDRVCVAILNGVEYPDMSAGQQIYCGVDCINTLSDHFGVEVPLFVDHAESMTLPIEADSQVIKLAAAEGIKELEITLEEKSETVTVERKADVA